MGCCHVWPETGHYRGKSRQGQKSTSAQQQGQEGQQEPCQSPSNPPAAGHWGMFQTKVSGMRSAGTWPCWRSWTVLIHAACQLKDSKRRWEYSWKKSAINLAQSCKAIFLFAYNPLKVFSYQPCCFYCCAWLDFLFFMEKWRLAWISLAKYPAGFISIMGIFQITTFQHTAPSH